VRVHFVTRVTFLPETDAILGRRFRSQWSMADSRNILVTVSLGIAVAAVGWALFATLDKDSPAAAPDATDRASAAPAAPVSGSSGTAMARPSGNNTNSGSIAVVTAPVNSERVSNQLSALGTAKANESVDITTKASNLVTGVKFQDGERVRRGQVLLELDSAQARADLAEAEAARTESTSQFNRSRELLSTKAVSESTLEQLESQMKANTARVAAANARLEDTVIRAPFNGRVGLRRVSIGSLVNPGTVITTLDDTSVIKVDFQVPENFLGSLREGLTVTALASAFPGREFAGKVGSVDSRVDTVTRSVTVRALMPNGENLLKPGMFLNVRIARDEREAMIIPEAALVPEQSRQFVYVSNDGHAQRREVQIGTREPGRVEIIAGLQPGERVVVEGTQKIRDGFAIHELKQPPPTREARR
jgi:membrane fusion protein (multidrug efflux system)